MPEDQPIVITGGSVVIEFDTDDLSPRQNGRFSNDAKKVTRIEVAIGEFIFERDVPDGKCTVRVHYK